MKSVIEIMGYGLVGEAINIWNPQIKSWDVDRYGSFVFSNAYWEYLLSEGYVKRWIECRQNQLSGEFGALSQSFADEWLEIVSGELRSLTQQDTSHYKD